MQKQCYKKTWPYVLHYYLQYYLGIKNVKLINRESKGSSLQDILLETMVCMCLCKYILNQLIFKWKTPLTLFKCRYEKYFFNKAKLE